jgi:uncharacterized protein (TIGR03032 family)
MLFVTDKNAPPVECEEAAYRYVHTTGFAELLETLSMSIMVSTYQAGKLVLLRSCSGRVSMLLRTFEQAMGLAVGSGRVAIGTRYQIWFLRNEPNIARQWEPSGRHDACFLPRSSHVTGDLRVHEIAWAGEEFCLVNTLFSCLCTLHPDWSFVPRWRPGFVTALAAEDRCHLNGLAVADGRPKYVTVFGETDGPEGWRPTKADGGCVIEVAGGQVVALLEFQEGVEEIFDIQVLPDVRFPTIVGLKKDTIRDIFVIPPEGSMQ